MKIGTIEAQPGSKAFGYFKTGETHGRFPVHIPLHIVAGAQPGPTLVVQAGTGGLEIEPALILPLIVKDLDPAHMAGTLVMVPLLNTSGFEFEQMNSVWDDKHPNRVGRGRAGGTITEQMVFQYYQQVLAHATAFIDIRSGSQWSYHWYSSVYSAGKTAEATALAAALGLPQVMLGQPEDQSMAREAALDGKLVVVAHTGGGPGLRDHRERDQERIRNAVLNAMRHLKMLHDAPVYETDTIPVIEAHTVLLAEGERGMVFVDASRRGSHIQAGEAIGYIRHPFTGEVLENITAPRAGVMLHAGTSWPMPLEGLPLAILGDVKQEIKVR